jgi:hypothetical protein
METEKKRKGYKNVDDFSQNAFDQIDSKVQEKVEYIQYLVSELLAIMFQVKDNCYYYFKPV